MGWRSNRRRYLAALGATAGLGGLAGCATLAEVMYGGGDEVTGDPLSGVEGRFPRPDYDRARTGHATEESGPTGEVVGRWRHRTGGRVTATPAVVDGTVYVGSSGGSVYALDAADGTERWSFEVGDGVGGGTAVVDGTVYVGSDGGSAYALDAADGTERWSFETDGEVAASPAVVDDTAYVGSIGGGVYALDAATGDRRWHYDTGGEVDSAPTVHDGVVYVSTVGAIHALEAGSGDLRWSERGIRAPAVADLPGTDGPTLFCAGRLGEASAVDAGGGEQLWTFEPDSDTGSLSFSPTVATLAGGESDPRPTVFVGIGATVFALDPADGTERWSFGVGGTAAPSPVVADGVVYPSGIDQHALDARTGDPLWSYEPDGYVTSPPAVVDGALFLGDDEGYVYALGPRPE